MRKETEKKAPSLELTDLQAKPLPTGPGSYIRKGGELVKVSGTRSAELFANNAPGAETTQAEANNPPAPATAASDEDVAAQLLLEVVDAIGNVDPADETLWTKQSGPRLSVLEQLVGHSISESLRSEAWQTYLKTQEN